MADSGRTKSGRAGSLLGSGALLALLQPGWRRDLTAGSRAADRAAALTLEGLAAADEAITTFLASYTTYLRTHARAAADAVTRRCAATSAAREAVAADEVAQRTAEERQEAAAARRERAESAVAQLRVIRRASALCGSDARALVREWTQPQVFRW